MGFELDSEPKNYVELGMGGQNSLKTQAPAAQQNELPLGPAVKPPQGYGMGETSAAAFAAEDSPLGKIANFFVGMNTPPGELATHDRLRLAKHKAFLDESADKLAWANYNDTHAVRNENLKHGNRQAIHDGMEFMANVKTWMSGMTPEEMEVSIPHFRNMLHHFNPELAELPQAFKNSPATMLGFDSAANDPVYGPGLKRLAAGRPYIDIVKDPEIQSYIKMHGMDVINKINTRIKKDDQIRIAKGEVGQEEYTQLYMAAAMDPSLDAKGIDLAFAKHALNTEYGEAIMTRMKIQTDKHALKMANKEKPDTEETMGGIKAQEYRKDEAKYNAWVALNKEHPGSIPDEQVAAQKKRLAIALGVENKDQGVNPQNNVNQRLDILSKGKYKNVDSLSDIKDPKERGQAYALAERARHEADQASAASAQAVKLSGPHNMVDKPIYTLNSAGEPVQVTGEVSEGDYMKGKAGFTMTPDQKDKYGQIKYAASEGNRIFDMADKAYKAVSPAEKAAQVGREKGLGSEYTAWTLTDSFPEHKAYLDERNSLLGKFSKSLGGEVGVLTQQDIERVVKMFPTPSDTEKIRAMKRAGFNRIIALNTRVVMSLIKGNHGTKFEGSVTPEQMSKMKADPKLRAEVEGTIGSIEGTVGSIEGSSPKDETKSSRGKSLIEEMKAGK